MDELGSVVLTNMSQPRFYENEKSTEGTDLRAQHINQLQHFSTSALKLPWQRSLEMPQPGCPFPSGH